MPRQLIMFAVDCPVLLAARDITIMADRKGVTDGMGVIEVLDFDGVKASRVGEIIQEMRAMLDGAPTEKAARPRRR